MPLNQSAVQVVHHLSNEQNDHCHKSPCCRRKNKTIYQNDLIHRDQPLPLMRNTDYIENFGIASHAIRDDILNSDDHHLYNTNQTKPTTVQNNSLSSTRERKEFSMLPFDTGPDTKQLYNEMVRRTRSNQ